MSQPGLYSKDELLSLGLKVGENVFIDRSVRFFGGKNIELGSDVRIDCFCLITAEAPVKIGNFVHIAPYTGLFGAAGMELEDYVGISSRVSLYSTSDDYSEGHLTNPMVPYSMRKVQAQRVLIRQHAIVGSGSVVLPGVTLGRGVAVGALSLVNKSVPDYLVVSGVPVRKVGVRNSEKLNEMEKQHKKILNQGGVSL